MFTLRIWDRSYGDGRVLLQRPATRGRRAAKAGNNVDRIVSKLERMKLKSKKDEASQRGSKHKKDQAVIEKSKIIKVSKAEVFSRTCDSIMTLNIVCVALKVT